MIALVVFSLVGFQFARIIHENVSMQHDLSDVTMDVGALRAKAVEERAQIRRLSDPRGAIPEIHSRLRYVRANEELVIVTKTTTPKPPSL